MAAIVRQLAGVFLGIVICILIIMAMEVAGHALLSGDAVFAAPLLAYLLASAVGGVVAVKVAGVRRWWLPSIVTGFLALGTVMNLAAMEHPVWFAPVAALALAAGFYAGWRFTAVR